METVLKEKTAHTNLIDSKKNKNDEFYTLLGSIEREVKNYVESFKGKKVYCPCDDYRYSNFVKFFKENYSSLGISELISTNYDIGDGAYCYIFDGKEEKFEKISGNGSFDSSECLNIMKGSDIVVTNPPFSLMRPFFKQIMENRKEFLIIGPSNMATYKDVFPFIRDNKLWLGCTSVTDFEVPSYDEENKNQYVVPETGKVMQKFGNICWYTNIQHNKRNRYIPLTRKYDAFYYKKYQNCDAIDVGKVKEIPYDYNGLMGVPISFLNKYNPEQFEIVRFRKGDDGKDLMLDGTYPYFRLLIRNKREEKNRP